MGIAMSNPFIPPPPVAAPDVIEPPDEVFGATDELHGPASPAIAPAVDVSADQPWQQVTISSREPIMVMGLHGGAGATTMTQLLADRALDVGTAWPVAGGWERPLPHLSVLAVCRNHQAGIRAGLRFARQWAAGWLPASQLVGIVIIDDGPQLLEAQKAATRRLAQMTPTGWHVPWHDQWRVEAPTLATAPRRVKKTIRTITTLVKE